MLPSLASSSQLPIIRVSVPAALRWGSSKVGCQVSQLDISNLPQRPGSTALSIFPYTEWVDVQRDEKEEDKIGVNLKNVMGEKNKDILNSFASQITVC